MANQVMSETDAEPGVGKLMGGILDDARELLVQQLALFQTEIKNDVHKVTMASIPLVIGGLFLMVAAIILGVASSYLLCALLPALPLWGGFAIVGGLFVPLGLGFVLWGNSQLNAIKAPPDQTIEGLKENIQWTTKK